MRLPGADRAIRCVAGPAAGNRTSRSGVDLVAAGPVHELRRGTRELLEHVRCSDRAGGLTMTKQTRFNIGYAIAAIFGVFLFQYVISPANRIAPIPSSTF